MENKMLHRPVFQMVIAEQNNGAPGLIFSAELPYDYSQNIAYCIPWDIEFSKLIYEVESKLALVLPFAKGEQVYKLGGRVSFPFVHFDLNKLGLRETVSFRFLLQDHVPRSILSRILPFRLFGSRRALLEYSYMGSSAVFTSREQSFVMIAPLLVEQLDQLYLKERIVAVGFTPMFGGYENYLQHNEQET